MKKNAQSYKYNKSSLLVNSTMKEEFVIFFGHEEISDRNIMPQGDKEEGDRKTPVGSMTLSDDKNKCFA